MVTYATGGLIEGPPDADLLAKFPPGCPTLSAEQVRQLGSGFLEKLNSEGPHAMPILQPPPFPTDDEADDEMSTADTVHVAVHAAVTAGVTAALGALTVTAPGGIGEFPGLATGLTDDEDELLDAWRQSDENHKLAALRVLQRGLDTKGE